MEARPSGRRSGRRRAAQTLVVVPIKLMLRAGQHDDLISFFRSLPSRGRAATIVALTRAFLSGEMPGLSRPQIEAQVEDELYSALKDLL